MTARVTVTENVYFQSDQLDSVPTGHGYSVEVISADQPYSRVVTVGEAWQPLDCGWLDRCSEMLLVNEGGGKPQSNPTDGQRQELEARVLEVGLIREDPDVKRTMHSPPKLPPLCFAPVKPGRSCRFPVADLKRIVLRCRRGQLRCKIFLTPE